METEIQKQIRELKERTEKRDFERGRDRSRSRIEQVNEDVGIFYRFWVQLAMAAFWVWQNILRPISMFFWKIAKFVFGIYRRLWSFFVYKRNEYGDLVFSKVRAGIFLIISLPLILTSGSIAVDSSIYALTQHHNETVYLFNASDNSFNDKDEFSITGCEFKEVDPSVGFECDDRDTVYFRVSPSWIEHFYSLVHNHDIFYAENIGAVVAPGWNICNVSSWYIRLKFLYRNTGVYPKLLRASCRPV